MRPAFLAFACAVLVSGASLLAQSTVSPSPVGDWRAVDVYSGRTFDLKLTADSTGLKGTLDNTAVQWEFADGELVVAKPGTLRLLKARELGTDAQKTDYTLVLRAKFENDGTLVGSSFVYIPGYGMDAVKRFDWKASRTAKR